MSTATHTPFVASHEDIYENGRSTDGSRPPALLINSDASAMVLAAAAHARADRLSKSLDLWVMTDKGDATATELAETLEPLAKEVDLLLSALMVKLK